MEVHVAADTLLILGGYGTTGRLIAGLLLQETDCRIVIAGRNPAKAEAAAGALGARFGPARVSAVLADAADEDSLRCSMAGCRLAVIASSTSDHAIRVARAAMDAACDTLDLQYSAGKLSALQALREEIERHRRCFITDGGFHPGLPALLVRALAERFDSLEEAVVGSVIQVDWRNLDLAPATQREFTSELLRYSAMEWRDGSWQRANGRAMWQPRTMDFGPPWGRRYGVPMFLEELRSLPLLYPSLRKVGFYVGGFNWFTDWIAMPASVVALKLWPERADASASRLLYWGLRRFSRPPFGTLLRAEAAGTAAGVPAQVALTLSHSDGYFFTAAPAVACLLQYLEGEARPGLWLQAHFAEPARMLEDMRRMGVAVRWGD